MKKSKIIVVSIIALLFTILAINKTYAYTPSIMFPRTIWNGEGSITVLAGGNDYKLYWQAVEMSNSNLQKLDKISEDNEKKIEDMKSGLNELNVECKNLQTIYNEKYTAYSKAVSDKKTQDEIDNAKSEYEKAKEEYQAKIEEYNEKIEVYNTKVKEYNSSRDKLIPTYVEGKWIEASDGKFGIDLSKYSDEKVWVVWAKLVVNNETYYNKAIYTMEGTKPKTIEAKGVNLNKSEVSIKEGSKYVLSATVTPTDATNKTVKWSSSNEQVATVKNGEVTGVKEGQAVITAKTEDGEFTATCKVIVTKEKEEVKDKDKDKGKEEEKDKDTNKEQIVKVNGVSLNQQKISLEEDENYELFYKVTPSEATNKNVKWSSSNEKIATVKDGKVTAIKEGEAVITVATEDGNYKTTCKVIVGKKKVTDPTVTPASKIPQAGTSFMMVGVLIALTILCVILYRKNKSLKF